MRMMPNNVFQIDKHHPSFFYEWRAVIYTVYTKGTVPFVFTDWHKNSGKDLGVNMVKGADFYNLPLFLSLSWFKN